MTDGSGRNHMEYDCSNADRLGNDAWIGAVFFIVIRTYANKKLPESESS